MITFVEHKNINKQKWDTCIGNSSNTSIFVYSWYLDIVSENWSALILNDYEAVFPIVSKSKYKISYLYQPYFTRYFGVYFQLRFDEKIVNEFINAILEKYKYIDICLHESNITKNNELEIKNRKFQSLDLKFPYVTIQKSYSENAKRNVKKAVKASLKVEQDISPEKIVSLFKTTKGGDLEIFNAKDYAVLINLMNYCIKNNKGQSFAVYDGDILCAAAFFMFNNNIFTYLKSGLTDEGKAKGAMYFLMDYFIKENSGNDYLLDFGGSSVESVAQFYKKFGAKDCVYLQIKKNKLPRLAKWIKKLKN